MPSANIPTPLLHATTRVAVHSLDARDRGCYRQRFVALVLSLLLLGAVPFDALAQASRHKRKKTNKPKASPCRTGCTPDTSAPEIAAAAPEDEAAQRELSGLARALHNATPGAYEKLSAFATKNAGNVRGARAALALGYDDYN